MFIDSSRFQIPFHFFYLLRPNLKYLNFKKVFRAVLTNEKLFMPKEKLVEDLD